MKKLGAAFILGLVVLSFCPAQVQTGNASYNPSKTGLTISHSTISFNTHVRVTNLLNNQSVEAVVNNRIPISAEWIADISGEAGDALGMSKTGMTPVEIAELPSRAGTVQNVVIPAPAPAPVPAPAPAAASSRQAQEQPPAAAAASVTQVLPIQTITDIEYVPVPTPVLEDCCFPLLWVIFALLILIIILLVIILVLIQRRLLLWPWHYPVWYRRHFLCAKKRRR
ncbi:MAG: hypothetical protein LBF77_09100 [Spirochaetaceae bacterium]|jgi:hypothetical protein|nr:hypothetical protein [Spirochaetaceae bacterium]